MVHTRSGVSGENVESTTESVPFESTNAETNIPSILSESEKLVEIICKIEKLLEENKLNFNVELKKLSSEILNLQTRIIYLEENSLFIQHTIKLHTRKLDDNEQYSRKVYFDY